MKATGEVMAIDRTFGAALNKALRGLEQAGAGPLGEDPSWRPTFDYLAAVYAGAGADDDDAADDVVIRWIDERGDACESTRFAQRSAAPIVLRQFVEPSDSRLWRVLGLLRRGVAQETIREATGISPWFLAEMGRNVGLEADVRAAGARIADPEDADGAQLLATAKRAGFADRDLAVLAGVGEGEIRATRGTLGLEPGYAMVDTCAAEFAAETPYFYSTYASAGSPPEAPPVQRPAALVIGSGPVRIGQGIEFDYCAVQAADVLRREGWSAVMVNSNPETVSTDFDASTRLYFEPLDAESVLSIVTFENGRPAMAPRIPMTPTASMSRVSSTVDGRVEGRAGARPGTARCRRWSRSAGRRRSTWPRRWSGRACRCSARASRPSTRPRSGRGSPRSSTASASRSPRAAWRSRSRRR